MTNILPIRVIDNHEKLMTTSQIWMNHYNFLLSLSMWTDSEKKSFEEDFNFNKVYDV
jgi:hypothetical protein